MGNCCRKVQIWKFQVKHDKRNNIYNQNWNCDGNSLFRWNGFVWWLVSQVSSHSWYPPRKFFRFLLILFKASHIEVLSRLSTAKYLYPSFSAASGTWSDGGRWGRCALILTTSRLTDVHRLVGILIFNGGEAVSDNRMALCLSMEPSCLDKPKVKPSTATRRYVGVKRQSGHIWQLFVQVTQIF